MARELARRLARIPHSPAVLWVTSTRYDWTGRIWSPKAFSAQTAAVVTPVASVLSLAADVTGGMPGPRLAAQLGRAGGNPLFVVELLAALLREGKISVGSGGAEIEANLPATTLAVSILHRLALLSAESVELLRVAAVCGQQVDRAELSLLSGDDAVVVGSALRAAGLSPWSAACTEISAPG